MGHRKQVGCATLFICLSNGIFAWFQIIKNTQNEQAPKFRTCLLTNLREPAFICYRNMALSLKTVLFWFLVTAHMILIAAELKRRMKLSQDEENWDTFAPYQFHDNLRSKRPPTGFEPGDTAAAFKVATLDGEFTYPPTGQQGSLIIHAFTNQSGFLECLWNSESSLADLVQELPESAQVLFLSYDDSAVSDALWMRDQVHRAATQR